MTKSWTAALALAAVVSTACSGGSDPVPTTDATTAAVTSSAAPSSSAAVEDQVLTWDLTTIPASWTFTRPEYAALGVYQSQPAGCNSTFDAAPLVVDGAPEGAEPVDSDTALDAALVSFAEKTGLSPEDVSAVTTDPREVPVAGSTETLTMPGRSLTVAESEGVAYGWSDGTQVLSVVVLCDGAAQDLLTTEVPALLDALTLTSQ